MSAFAMLGRPLAVARAVLVAGALLACMPAQAEGAPALRDLDAWINGKLLAAKDAWFALFERAIGSAFGLGSDPEPAPSAPVAKVSPGPSPVYVAEGQTGGAVRVSLLSSPIEGVKVSAGLMVLTGTGNGYRLHVKLDVPPNERLCIDYLSFETVGVLQGDTTHRYNTTNLHKCLPSAPAEGGLDSVDLVRRDVPQSRHSEPHADSATMRDGFVVLAVKLGDRLAFYRIDSSHFMRARNARH